MKPTRTIVLRYELLTYMQIYLLNPKLINIHMNIIGNYKFVISFLTGFFFTEECVKPSDNISVG